MKRIVVSFLAVIAVLGVVGYSARNYIVRRSLEIGVMNLTGFPLEIGGVDVGVFTSRLELRDIKLMNPPGFDERTFVDLPLFQLHYTLRSFLGGAPRFQKMVVNVRKVVIVKNATGQTNASVIQDKFAFTAGSDGGGNKTVASASKTAYRVDLLRVHIGTVTMKDFSKAHPTERNLTFDRNVVFENISESTSVATLVMQVVLGQLSDVAGGFIKGRIKEGAQTIQKSGQDLLDSVRKSIPLP